MGSGGSGVAARSWFRRVQRGQYAACAGQRVGGVAKAGLVFFFQAEDGIRDKLVTGVQTCALPISFLGLGVQPPTPSWGTMLSDAQSYIQQAPYLAMLPGLSIFGATLAFNLLGDGDRKSVV